MRDYRLTPAAQADVASIWDFTQEHWGENQAQTYLLELRAAMERIAEKPDRGRERSDVLLGYRSYAIGRHAVFYWERENGVDVIRILHQSMDPSKHL